MFVQHIQKTLCLDCGLLQNYQRTKIVCLLSIVKSIYCIIIEYVDDLL